MYKRMMAGRKLSLFVWAIFIGGMVVLTTTTKSVAQYGGGGRGITGQVGIPATQPEKQPIGGSGTKVIPSVSVQERYDSNVYFVQGRSLEDYVTTLSPQVRVEHKSSLIDATGGGGATGEIYVKNPGLNYVAGNGLLNLDLSRATNELVRGLGLRLSDSIRYTPQTPAFAAPTDGGQLGDSFVRGIQARRANSWTNAGKVEASYEVSPIVSLTSAYMDQRIRFGRTLAPAGGGTSFGQLFGTTFQTVTSGPVVKASPVDMLTLYHQYQKATFERPGNQGGFSTQGVIAGWTRLLTPTLTAAVTGGVTVFERTNRVHFVGSASLAWRGQDTDVTVGYSRSVAPNFYFTSNALVSQVVSATVGHNISESLALSVSGNYAHSESASSNTDLKFDSYAVIPSATYHINRILTASLSYTHSMFDRKLSGKGFNFDRDMVLLRLVAEWK